MSRPRRGPKLPKTASGVVRDIGSAGDAVVDTEHGVVFAPLALPGERVVLDRLHKNGGVLRGRVREVSDPSAERRVPPCSVAAACGGCPLMIAEPNFQHELGLRRVTEAVAGLTSEHAEVDFRVFGAELGYRRRARLSFARGKLGYRVRRSKELVTPDSCKVLDPALDQVLGALRTHVMPLLAGSGEISLALAQGGATVAIRAEAPQAPELFTACEALAGEHAVGVGLRAAGATSDAIWGDPLERSLGADGEELVGPQGGFSQANDAVNVELTKTVRELAEAKDQRVLELYAGHGNLTVLLARDAAKLTAVEIDDAASRALGRNLAARNLEATVVTGRAEDPPGRGPVDVVVLDPPRTGARDAVAGILARRPRRIVYVSCDTATLRRDLGALAQGGYLVDVAVGFAMFPQTAHIECVVRLRR